MNAIIAYVIVALLKVVETQGVDHAEFTCIKKGRFIDETDLDCKRYFLCSQKKNGKFVKTTYSCPETSNFDTDLGYCTSSAICIYSTTTTASISTETTAVPSVETTEGTTLSDDDTTEEVSTTSTIVTSDTTTTGSAEITEATTSSSIEASKDTSPTDSVSSETTSMSNATDAYTTDDATTPSPETSSTTPGFETTEAISTVLPSNSNYTCKTPGRFPDTDACDCGWFYDCKLHESQLLSTRLYCPPNSKFDPDLAICSINYHCVQEFVCTENGVYADPHDLNNNTYYQCEETYDGSFLQTHYKCLQDMVFNQTLNICVPVEILTTSSEEPTTIPETTGAPHTTVGSSLTKFNCTENGRFSDPNDEICKWYFLCIDKQSFHYNCPNGLYFDPQQQECRSEYQCQIDSATEKWTTAFHCQKRGYFRNNDDTSSKSYHFCDVLGDGKIYQYELVCPTQYVFDANTNLCQN